MSADIQDIIKRLKIEICSMDEKYDAGKYKGIEDCYWLMKDALEQRVEALSENS